ncbi:MAG: stage III sporulation protein AF [Maledivibacter sp.]|jgi:stage III sporulation protein AF|nr:stage III sporulation protein AF [Maledivibacter sp.]
MIEGIKIWIKNIVTVIILMSFLEILVPNGKIKKYLKLIFGFIVMLIILNPIINFINNNDELENEVFKISNELTKKEYSFINSNIENKQIEQLASLYKNRIEEDIVFRVESKYDVRVTRVNVEIDSSTEEKMGEIKGLELIVTEKKEKTKQEAIPIVKIDISDSEGKNVQNNSINGEENLNNGLMKKIQEDITNIYSLDDNKVIVSN